MNTEIEDKKIITDFMRFPTYGKSGYIYRDSIYTAEEFDYNSNWFLLMDIVDKIEKTSVKNLSFTVDICKDIVIINVYGDALINNLSFKSSMILITEEGETKITNLYNACIQFIKWYNQNK